MVRLKGKINDFICEDNFIEQESRVCASDIGTQYRLYQSIRLHLAVRYSKNHKNKPLFSFFKTTIFLTVSNENTSIRWGATMTMGLLSFSFSYWSIEQRSNTKHFSVELANSYSKNLFAFCVASYIFLVAAFFVSLNWFCPHQDCRFYFRIRRWVQEERIKVQPYYFFLKFLFIRENNVYTIESNFHKVNQKEGNIYPCATSGYHSFRFKQILPRSQSRFEHRGCQSRNSCWR